MLVLSSSQMDRGRPALASRGMTKALPFVYTDELGDAFAILVKGGVLRWHKGKKSAQRGALSSRRLRGNRAGELSQPTYVKWVPQITETLSGAPPHSRQVGSKVGSSRRGDTGWRRAKIIKRFRRGLFCSGFCTCLERSVPISRTPACEPSIVVVLESEKALSSPNRLRGFLYGRAETKAWPDHSSPGGCFP